MKKILGCFAIGCLVPAVALVILGLILPGEWSVQRSVTISAPPEEIHPLLEDFRRWEEWVRWEEEGGSSTEISYSGAERGVGAILAWDGEQMGQGRLTITESSPATGIGYTSAIQSATENGRGSITLQTVDGGTRVTWTDEGELPPVIGGLLSWMVNAGLGKKFQEDLIRLKQTVEGPTEENGDDSDG